MKQLTASIRAICVCVCGCVGVRLDLTGVHIDLSKQQEMRGQSLISDIFHWQWTTVCVCGLHVCVACLLGALVCCIKVSEIF